MMNFEQLKLQIHMRKLYETMGAMDAELVIVDAFLREQARHERIQTQLPTPRSRVHPPTATVQPDDDRSVDVESV